MQTEFQRPIPMPWHDPDGHDAFDSVDGRLLIGVLKTRLTDEQIVALHHQRIERREDGNYDVWFVDGTPDGVIDLTMCVALEQWFIRRWKAEEREVRGPASVNALTFFVTTGGVSIVRASDIADFPKINIAET